MSKPTPSTHNIVVLGGSFAGLNIAHKLLRNTTPLLKTQQPTTIYKITIISESIYFYWTVGASRAILNLPDYPLETSFLPVAQGFEQYDEKEYEIMYGTVTGLDFEKRSLVLEKKEGGEENIGYDSLIVATGARSREPLWSLHGGHEATEEALKSLHARVPKAKTILIAGGGAAGVETAGELGYHYGAKGVLGTKEIVVLSGTSRLLPAVRADVGGQAQKQLEAMGVKVLHELKVEKAETVGEKTKLSLSDGSTKEVDIYLDATGRRPHAPFVPAKFKDELGAIIVDDHLAIIGTGERVWAFGDVASASKGGIFDIQQMAPILHNNVEVALGIENRVLQPYKKLETMTMAVPVGPKGGVMVLFDWKLWSWFVWLVKARDMMIGRMIKNLNGTA